MRPYRFAFVSNSAEIGETLKHYVDPDREELVVELATMEEAVSVAWRLLDSGTEVIIGGGGTGNLLHQTMRAPIVKIARTHLDLIRALIKARKQGSFIGLASFAEPPDGMDIIEELLSIRLRHIVFRTTDDLTQGIAEAVKDKVDCIVGAGICRQIAVSLGSVGIVVTPSKDGYLQALRDARNLAAIRRRERQESEQLSAIIQTIREGVILIDDTGRIKLLNQAAAEVFDTQASAALGKPLPEVVRGTGLLNVLTTGRPEVDQIRRAGKSDIVITSLPISVDGETQGVVATFREAARIQTVDRRLREELYTRGFVAKHSVGHLKGRSPRMSKLVGMAGKYAITDQSILIEGETGTGKEVLAQSIHNLSTRKNRPFVAINCSALSDSLLESELFGYEEGAFTGAKKGGKLGLFELANQGSVFLDEIADMPPGLQVRLLRVLEQREVMRVGGDKVVPVDVRILASTCRNLAHDLRNQRFRIDLYFRLAVLKLDIPPLRERLEDLPDIVRSLLDRFTGGTKRVSDSVFPFLHTYHWPGNIRELDSLVKRYAVLLGDSPCDDALFLDVYENLKMDYGLVETNSPRKIVEAISDDSSRTLKETIEDHERVVIEQTLKECNFSRRDTARKLGISVNTLWRKMNPAQKSR